MACNSILAALPAARITIGAETFSGRYRDDLAPMSCARLRALVPYQGDVIHARWSGEAIWSPLAAVWPPGTSLPPEHGIGSPQPGQVLLFAAEESEPEVLIAYGFCRFASRVGPLEGSPVLSIEDRLSELAWLGSRILWDGAKRLVIQ